MPLRRLLLLLASFLFAAVVAQAAPPWRGIWEWSCPKRTEADLAQIAESAHSLGFNVLMMAPPAKWDAFMADQCHQRGMKLYLSTVFSGGSNDWQQVMTPDEQARARLPLPDQYMYGGEPVLPGEVFSSPLPCFARPEVREYFRKQVVENAARPVDGLAFDMVGYQNYCCCHCAACRGLDPEQVLVSFINDMAATARKARPGIELSIHIYPWFAPDPYYGCRTDIDYVGETVSWFFRPHWPLCKVQARVEGLVRQQHAVYPHHCTAPFVGFDPRKPRDYRPADRVGQELAIINHSGAQALQMAELGYLLRKPLVAQAVAREFGGTYRAPARPSPR